MRRPAGRFCSSFGAEKPAAFAGRIVEDERDGLGAVPDVELPENVLDVGSDGLRADEQAVGDLVLVQAVGQQEDDLALARRRGRASWSAGELVRRGERGKPADARDELARVEGLCQIVVAADEQAGAAIEGLDALAGDEDDPDRPLNRSRMRRQTS